MTLEVLNRTSKDVALVIPLSAKHISPQKQLGRQIAAACELAGVTQVELAQKIHRCPRQVQRYINGEVSRMDWEIINAIADATGQSLEAFRVYRQ